MKHLLALLTALVSSTVFASGLTIKEPFAFATIPGAANSAAFMTLTNQTDQAISLVAAESAVGERIELHNHINDNGVMRMRQVDSIDLPAGETVELKRGGLHVMLMQLNQTLDVGSTVDIDLIDTQGNRYPVNAQIKDIRASMKHDMHNDHGKHKGHKHDHD